MAPRRRPSSGFFGMRERPSGRFAAEITVDGVRWWIGTFDSMSFAAHADESTGGTAAALLNCGGADRRADGAGPFAPLPLPPPPNRINVGSSSSSSSLGSSFWDSDSNANVLD
ncbi:hypothetical protein ZWY2020_001896 [Hordeum vulgare]|nr:hypothetical protein ZWY2020_001896 [Hordeum vulgare]